MATKWLTTWAPIIGTVGTLVTACLVWWYTRITSRLMQVTAAAYEPFVILTMGKFSHEKRAGILFARNVGRSPAVDVVIRVDPGSKALSGRLKSEVRCDLLSPHGGQTELALHVPLDESTEGLRFTIDYRNVAGQHRQAPAALILDPGQDSLFRWEFPK